MVVVLPTPLTPTNIHTFGLPGSPSTNTSERSDESSRAVISACSASSSCCGSVISFEATRLRSSSISACVTPTPTSARSSASSRSSNVASLIAPRPSTPAKAPVNVDRALASRSRRDAGGASTIGSGSTTSGSTTSGSTTVGSATVGGPGCGGGTTGGTGRVGAGRVRAALRRLTTSTPMPNTTTATARIRNRNSIPISVRRYRCPSTSELVTLVPGTNVTSAVRWRGCPSRRAR